MLRVISCTLLFGFLWHSTLARMGLGAWESTEEQENVGAYLQSIFQEKGIFLWEANHKLYLKWDYSRAEDRYQHTIRLTPLNVSITLTYRGTSDELQSLPFGDQIVDYSFPSFNTTDKEDETGTLHADFKFRDDNKTWTADYDFRDDGTLFVTGKVGDIVAKMLFRPFLSSLAQGTWEATTEGQNLEHWNEVVKSGPERNFQEKHRMSIRREGDHYIKTSNSSKGIVDLPFQLNKPVRTGKTGSDPIEVVFDYDIATDELHQQIREGSNVTNMTYYFDERGAYGIFRNGDSQVGRFYKRIIPDDFLGLYQFSGKQMNAKSFMKAFVGYENPPNTNWFHAQQIEFKRDNGTFSETIYYLDGSKLDFSFTLGLVGHTVSFNNTATDYMYSHHYRMGRQVLQGNFWTVESPPRRFSITYELAKNNTDLTLTFDMDIIVAKRWYVKM